MALTHIAWDFDGTLINCHPLWQAALTDYAEDHGLAIPDEAAIKACFGNPTWQIPAWHLPMEEQQRHIRLAYQRFFALQQEAPQHLPPIPGIIETILQLAACGMVQSIITSRPRQPLRAMLDYLQLHGAIHAYNSRDCAAAQNLRDKPAPDKLLFVIQELNVKATTSLMIGDTAMDIRMAKQAGVAAIAVTWGMGTEADLRAAGADWLVTEPTQLRAVIAAAIAKSEPQNAIPTEG